MRKFSLETLTPKREHADDATALFAVFENLQLESFPEGIFLIHCPCHTIVNTEILVNVNWPSGTLTLSC